jgi:hypothetical protein
MFGSRPTLQIEARPNGLAWNVTSAGQSVNGSRGLYRSPYRPDLYRTRNGSPGGSWGEWVCYWVGW